MTNSIPRRTILLVDDEDMVLNLGRIILERRGYAVHVSTSGQDALAVCLEGAVTPDCLVIDSTMPGMSGRETLVEIRKILPAVPALISSGHSEEQLREEMNGIAVSGYIHKPYRHETLLTAIEGAFAAQ